MKCPYQTITKHIPEHEIVFEKVYAQDITEFGECWKNDCPFYYTTEYNPARIIYEHCRRTEQNGVKK